MSDQVIGESLTDRIDGMKCEAQVCRVKNVIGVMVREPYRKPLSFVGNPAQINELINTLTRHMRDANQWEIENAD